MDGSDLNFVNGSIAHDIRYAEALRSSLRIRRVQLFSSLTRPVMHKVRVILSNMNDSIKSDHALNP
jgi:hypothetical protein